NTIVHAHNEFLETLADLGIVGCIALVGAILVTLIHAVRFVSSKERTHDPSRWRVIGLSAALVAVLVDQCFEPALRIPGLAPILLTCWALLWAMVRRNTVAVEARSDQDRLSNSKVRAAGALVCAAAVGLGYLGVRDWQGVRARYDAEVALSDGRLDDAVERADFAAQHTLAPYRRVVPRRIAVQARVIAFGRVLENNERPPNDAEIALAYDARRRISQIERAAPRFWRISQLQVSVCRALVVACHRRNETRNEQFFAQSLVVALERWRADEPFLSAAVVRLWQARPGAPVTDRLKWMRCLMRGGEIDPAFRSLFAMLVQHPNFATVLDDLLNIANEDKERAPKAWKDSLSPETLRIRALYVAVQGRHREAAQFARSAADLYRRAGTRLFAGHIAALHEAVIYEFSESPVTGSDGHLSRLAEAWAVEGGPTDPDTPLVGPIGWTRLSVLLAAGREQEADRQIVALDQSKPIELTKGAALARIAGVFADDARFGEEAERWAQRACSLAPHLPSPVGLCVKFALRRGDDDSALAAAERVIELSDDGQAEWADRFLDTLQKQYPASTIWVRLERTLEKADDGTESPGGTDSSPSKE
ncbi:MAG: hypothetical protein O7F76_11995, partial [Planctomycetota bacterium]|nr:hypothetical protein [Planctomycetota bacterium]